MLGCTCLIRTSLTIACAEVNIWELAFSFTSTRILVLAKRPEKRDENAIADLKIFQELTAGDFYGHRRWDNMK